MIRVLIVDDEESICEFLSIMLKRENYTVETAQDVKTALKKIEIFYPDIVITDIRMPEMDGLSLLSEVKKLKPDTLVILITAYASLESAISAVKREAFDYITKPFKADEIKIALKRAVENINLRKENLKLREQLEKVKFEEEVIGKSPAFREILEIVERVANTDSTILIYGESGTGKEVIANLIHKMSPRKDFPFIPISCGALPETLLESELFGHTKGSFTGAVRDKEGLLKSAEGGTLFLDEIGVASQKIQIGLLRVLEEKEIIPVGSTKPIKVNVRLITATNIDLEEMVKENKFRKDLFYRLNVIPIKLPPLRERKEDIPLLAQYFLKKYSSKNKVPLKKFSPSAMKLLEEYEWPGNIRELENIVERAVILSNSSVITPLDLPENIKLDKVEDLNKRQREIIEYLKKHRVITTRICSQLFNVTDRTARNDLSDLLDKKIVIRKGKGDKNASYTLAEI